MYWTCYSGGELLSKIRIEKSLTGRHVVGLGLRVPSVSSPLFDSYGAFIYLQLPDSSAPTDGLCSYQQPSCIIYGRTEYSQPWANSTLHLSLALIRNMVRQYINDLHPGLSITKSQLLYNNSTACVLDNNTNSWYGVIKWIPEFNWLRHKTLIADRNLGYQNHPGIISKF